MMDAAKSQFVQETFLSLVKTLSADAPSKWGKMQAQQMVEHVSGFFKVSTKELQFPQVTPAEQLPQYKAFLLSDKPFRENTKAPVLPETPLPVRKANMAEAVAELEAAIASFYAYFETDPLQTTPHPVFGELNFEEWILLHYKHVTHHARQFGLMD